MNNIYEMKQIIRELLEQYEKDMDMPQFAIQYYTDEYIISKHYGFIKWLVDNDKIETNNLSLMAFKNVFSGGGFVEVSDLEVILMLLAISDTPIDDLISYLK